MNGGLAKGSERVHTYHSTFSSSQTCVVDLVADGLGGDSAQPLLLRVVDERSVRRRANGYTQGSQSDN